MVDLAQAAVWHRQVAALAAAADRVGVADLELPAVRERLLAQQERFALAAAHTGGALPTLVPTPTEISAAAPALGDLSAQAVAEALRTISSTLDATDAVLADHLSPPTAAQAPTQISVPSPVPPAPQATPAVPPPLATYSPTAARGPGVAGGPGAVAGGAATVARGAGVAPAGTAAVSGWPVGVRNALIYGGFSCTVLIAQIVLLATLDEERTLPLMAPVCLVVLPAFAWAAGWFTIGVAFGSPQRGPVKRTPRLGALVCLVPNILLCAGLGVLFLINLLNGDPQPPSDGLVDS